MDSGKFRVNLSKIGKRMNRLTGVRAIMKDISEVLRNPNAKDFCNLSAGNPVILPEVESLWRELTRELLASPEYGNVICRYGMTHGYEPLLAAVARFFNKQYGLSLTESNVLITPGSQSLYFFAANAFAGYTDSGDLKRLVLPLCPDYTGYGGVCVAAEAVVSYQPDLEVGSTPHRFKYRPNFAGLQIDNSTGCVIFSRPSNPTGNVLSDEEVRRIAAMAEKVQAPVFVDAAYGPPIPAINFTEMTPIFAPNIVNCMTISKAGLAGERVGIAVGDRNILEVLECFESNAMIHSSRLGQAIVAKALDSGALYDLALKVIRPFYRKKFNLLEETLAKHMPQDLPWFLHLGEGSIFAWLWFDNLPVSDGELYQRLKKAGVIAVPGNPFFPGLSQPWKHTEQCLRLSLTASDAHITEGIRRLALVVDETYRQR